MEVKVYDNLFTDKFLTDLNILSRKFPWDFTNSANRKMYPMDCPLNKGSHLFFGHRLYEWVSYYNVMNKCPAPFFEVIEYFVLDILQDNNIKLGMIDANLQVKGQTGHAHRDVFFGDEKDRTILFYPHYKWDKSWGGALEILDDDDNVIESLLPLPGRIIYFDSSVKHRALAPKVYDVPRISLAYRMEKH